MFYLYILKSKKDDNLYIGYTENLRQRIKKHNQGLVKSTKPRIPLEIIYYEAYLSKKDAKHREQMLKRYAGSYIHLKKRIKNSLIISK